MSLYCASCTQAAGRATWLSEGEMTCSSCGRSDVVRCGSCNELVMVGLDHCARCSPVEMVETRRGGTPAGEMVPSLPPLGSRGLSAAVVPLVPVVSEQYGAGRYGVKAVVTIPAGDLAGERPAPGGQSSHPVHGEHRPHAQADPRHEGARHRRPGRGRDATGTDLRARGRSR